VFPGNQGGPLEHVIAGKAVSFLEAMKKSFQTYQENVILNTQAMVNEFKKQGMRIVSRGTDNHLFVIDISDFDLDSKEIQNGLEEVNIYVNKNTIPFDQRSPFNPSGIRIGSPAMTTRGMKEREARKIVQLIMKLINNFHNQKNREEVKEEVKKMCLKFPIYKGLKW
jgi:glycine hydroxymethyltransferase